MPRVLVFALENWLGAASLPRALHRAGFEVSLLCYPNTLISLTKFSDDRDLCLPNEQAEAIFNRLHTLSCGRSIRLIIPADGRAQRFLQHIVEVASIANFPRETLELVRSSLPDPAAFKYGDDKEAASQLMDDLGFRTPPRSLIWDKGELADFVGKVGLPAVIKPITGTAGEGVQFLHSEEDVRSAKLNTGSQWMAQKYIVGKPAGSASVALEGKCLGTLAFEKTLTYPGEMGPASVVTRLENEEISRGAAAFAKAANYTGFFSPGYMIETGTGLPYFLEVNTRPVPMVPASGKLGLDLCRLLYSKLVGAPLPEPDPAAPSKMAFYPQELHRDPDSPFKDLLLDEPFEDPMVHLAMRKGIEMLASGRLQPSE